MSEEDNIDELFSEYLSIFSLYRLTSTKKIKDFLLKILNFEIDSDKFILCSYKHRQFYSYSIPSKCPTCNKIIGYNNECYLFNEFFTGFTLVTCNECYLNSFVGSYRVNSGPFVENAHKISITSDCGLNLLKN